MIRSVALVAAAIGCRGREPTEHRAAPVHAGPDVVALATTPIRIDGELSEPDWPQHSLRGHFLGADGEPARPSSEIRLLRDDHNLLVGLYAADENIQARDAFDLTLGNLALRVDSSGNVSPPVSGVKAAVDEDEGTRDDPRDDDEEWVVELVVPLGLTGLRPGVHQQLRAGRCDVTKDGIERCGSWTASVTIE